MMVTLVWGVRGGGIGDNPVSSILRGWRTSAFSDLAAPKHKHEGTSPVLTPHPGAMAHQDMGGRRGTLALQIHCAEELDQVLEVNAVVDMPTDGVERLVRDVGGPAPGKMARNNAGDSGANEGATGGEWRGCRPRGARPTCVCVCVCARQGINANHAQTAVGCITIRLLLALMVAVLPTAWSRVYHLQKTQTVCFCLPACLPN